MQEGWTFASAIWGDSTLIVPLFGPYNKSAMAAESALARCLGFTLSNNQVITELIKAIDSGLTYRLKYDIINGNKVVIQASTNIPIYRQPLEEFACMIKNDKAIYLCEKHDTMLQSAETKEELEVFTKEVDDCEDCTEEVS
jgi:hypothetical protein